MIMFRPTWEGWVHLLGLRHGQLLNAKDANWLLWERTAFPMTTDLGYLGPQVHQALERPMTDEEFMDANDPLTQEADRLATELGHVSRDLQDVVAEVATLRAENTRLEETVVGWRKENDRHRHLYVEATKAGQDVTAERDRLRAALEAIAEADPAETRVGSEWGMFAYRRRQEIARAALDVSPNIGGDS
jgi:regulator of replication initiation timing